MRDNGVDMWMHVIRDGNPDPLALDLGTPLDLRGTTSYFIFTDRGSERIERAVLGGRNEGIREGDGEIYDFFGASTDLRQFVQARDPQAIAVNTSTSVPAGGVYEAIENHSAHRGIVKLTLSERTYRVELTSFALIGRHRLPPARR